MQEKTRMSFTKIKPLLTSCIVILASSILQLGYASPHYYQDSFQLDGEQPAGLHILDYSNPNSENMLLYLDANNTSFSIEPGPQGRSGYVYVKYGTDLEHSCVLAIADEELGYLTGEFLTVTSSQCIGGLQFKGYEKLSYDWLPQHRRYVLHFRQE